MNRRFWIPAAGVAVILVSYFLLAGRHGLLEPDEGRYAEIGREMLESGDYLAPTLNGFPHFQKPPVVYWLTAGAFALVGVNETGARLPSIAAAIGTLACAFLIASCWFNRRVAAMTVLVLASSIEFFFLARTLTPDMTMTLWITAAVACLTLRRRFGNSGWRSEIAGGLFFVFMGLGFLTKGPVALIIPVFAAAGLFAGEKLTGGPVTKLRWLPGLALTLAMSLSWFLLVALRHGELFEYFWTHELVNRLSGSGHGRRQPVWFYIPILLVGFMPWTIFLAAAVIRALRQRRWRGGWTSVAPPFWLLAGWIVPSFAVLSISGSKLLTYVLPLFPALAILMAVSIEKLFAKAPPRFAAGCACVLFAAFPVLALTWNRVASAGTAIGWNAGGLVFLCAASAGAIVLTLGALRKGNAFALCAACAVGSLAIWLSASLQFGVCNPHLGQQASVRELAGFLKGQPDFGRARIIVAGARAHGFEFYLGRTVEATRGDADIVLTPDADQERRLHRNAGDVSALEGGEGGPVYVLTRSGTFTRYFEEGSWEQLWKSGDFVLAKADRR